MAYHSLVKKHGRIGFYILLCSVFFIACGDHQPETQSGTKPGVSASSDIGFSRRFEGLVAGRQITLQITATYGRYTGTYYYEEQGLPIKLNSFTDTSAKGLIHLDEFPLTESISEKDGQSYWLVQFSQDSVSGTRFSKNGTISDEIRLKENYSAGSYPFELIYKSTKASYHESSDTPFAVSTYRLFWPAVTADTSADAFIARSLLEIADCGNKENGTSAQLMECIETKDKDYFREYRRIISETHMAPEEWSHAFNNYSKDLYWDIAGNGKGWLVLEVTPGEYTGGAHGNYGVFYYCLDVQGRRTWTLQDIMSVDSSKLKVLLDISARKHFQLGTQAPLQDRLLVSEIPITANVCITPAGILFCYQPYEIASYADGPVSLFISYKELKHLLTEPFKIRMQLFRAYSTPLI